MEAPRCNMHGPCDPLSPMDCCRAHTQRTRASAHLTWIPNEHCRGELFPVLMCPTPVHVRPGPPLGGAHRQCYRTKHLMRTSACMPTRMRDSHDAHAHMVTWDDCTHPRTRTRTHPRSHTFTQPSKHACTCTTGKHRKNVQIRLFAKLSPAPTNKDINTNLVLFHDVQVVPSPQPASQTIELPTIRAACRTAVSLQLGSPQRTVRYAGRDTAQHSTIVVMAITEIN